MPYSRLPDIWITRNRPGGPDARGAEDQALHIAEAATTIRPVVTVARADDPRQAALAGTALPAAEVTDRAGAQRRFRFDVEVTHPAVEGSATANPHIVVSLHLPRGASPGDDAFHQVIEQFLRGPEFAGTVSALLPGTSRPSSSGPVPQFDHLFALQNQLVLDSPAWDLPLGPRGTPLDRSDVIFHIPLGEGPAGPEQWVTDEGSLLAPHVRAYRGGTSHRQAFLCFSEYTRRVAERIGVPASRILEFPIALPPGRVSAVARDLRPEITGERIAWIGPANAEEKGLGFLMTAVAIANDRLAAQGRRIAVDAYGRFPARGDDPDFDAAFDARYAGAVASGALAFHGFVADDARAAMLATRDLITVNASRPSCEGFGMASAEALISAGCGYATRPGGGAEDAATVFDRAFVASDDTPEALATAIIAAVDAERRQLAAHGPAWRHTARRGSIVSFGAVVRAIEGFTRALRSGPSAAGQEVA